MKKKDNQYDRSSIVLDCDQPIPGKGPISLLRVTLSSSGNYKVMENSLINEMFFSSLSRKDHLSTHSLPVMRLTSFT